MFSDLVPRQFVNGKWEVILGSFQALLINEYSSSWRQAKSGLNHFSRLNRYAGSIEMPLGENRGGLDVTTPELATLPSHSILVLFFFL